MAIGLKMGGIFTGILALIFGILIFKFPKLLSQLIGIYLIIIGVLSIIAAL